MPKSKIPEQIELTIDAVGFEGKSIAHHQGLVYFVEGGIPGDRVMALVRRRKARYIEATVAEILQPSPGRVDPPCQHFGECGGCKWQHLKYAQQLLWKQQHVQDSFERLGKVAYGQLEQTLGCPDPYWYRNKMEFSFGDSRWITQAELGGDLVSAKNFALGLHVPGRYDKVLDVQECWLQSPLSNRILNAVRTAALQLQVSVYATHAQTGFLRNLVIRTAVATGEVMVVLVTSPIQESPDTKMVDWFAQEFTVQFPQVTTTLHAVTTSKALVATGETTVLTGSGSITEQLLGQRFRISPFSFFQTNSRQAEALLRVILEYANLQLSDTVWDWYCGTGSISLCIARYVKRVIGLEVVASAIEDARNNAVLNGLDNVEFFLQDLHKTSVNQVLQQLPDPDVIILDPPRAGIDPETLKRLVEIGSPRLVYVSCNPATQARDCALLAADYVVEKIQPVDMFPNTYHVETVALLRKRSIQLPSEVQPFRDPLGDIS